MKEELTPREASQGGRPRSMVLVLIFSLALLALIGAVLLGWI